MDMVESGGWKLGDDPEQLSKKSSLGCLTKVKHLEIKKGDPSGMKGLFSESQVQHPKGLQGHPRGTRDVLLEVKPGQFTTAKDLYGVTFEQLHQPMQQKMQLMLLSRTPLQG